MITPAIAPINTHYSGRIAEVGLAKDPAERRAAYRALFRSELDTETVKEIRAATNGGYALGGKRFLAQIEAAVGRRVTRGKAGRPPAATDAVPAEQTELF